MPVDAQFVAKRTRTNSPRQMYTFLRQLKMLLNCFWLENLNIVWHEQESPFGIFARQLQRAKYVNMIVISSDPK